MSIVHLPISFATNLRLCPLARTRDLNPTPPHYVIAKNQTAHVMGLLSVLVEKLRVFEEPKKQEARSKKQDPQQFHQIDTSQFLGRYEETDAGFCPHFIALVDSGLLKDLETSSFRFALSLLFLLMSYVAEHRTSVTVSTTENASWVFTDA
jgi:hypothetical protein